MTTIDPDVEDILTVSPRVPPPPSAPSTRSTHRRRARPRFTEDAHPYRPDHRASTFSGRAGIAPPVHRTSSPVGTPNVSDITNMIVEPGAGKVTETQRHIDATSAIGADEDAPTPTSSM